MVLWVKWPLAKREAGFDLTFQGLRWKELRPKEQVLIIGAIFQLIECKKMFNPSLAMCAEYQVSSKSDRQKILDQLNITWFPTVWN